MSDQNLQKPNTVMLENRAKLTITGVRDVDSFDEQNVVAYTDYGQLTIQGSSLSISQLSVESGDLLIEGNVSSLLYTDNRPNEGFFKRLFR